MKNNSENEMKYSRKGLKCRSFTDKEMRRRYRLHFGLKQKGNVVKCKDKTIYKRPDELTKTENRWITELTEKFDYCVQLLMF